MQFVMEQNNSPPLSVAIIQPQRLQCQSIEAKHEVLDIYLELAYPALLELSLPCPSVSSTGHHFPLFGQSCARGKAGTSRKSNFAPDLPLPKQERSRGMGAPNMRLHDTMWSKQTFVWLLLSLYRIHLFYPILRESMPVKLGIQIHN